jgi:hypothetical protein
MTRQVDTSTEALRQRLHVGEYRVDPTAVADAIVRRRWSVAIAPSRPARLKPRESLSHHHFRSRALAVPPV